MKIEPAESEERGRGKGVIERDEPKDKVHTPVDAR